MGRAFIFAVQLLMALGHPLIHMAGAVRASDSRHPPKQAFHPYLTEGRLGLAEGGGLLLFVYLDVARRVCT